MHSWLCINAIHGTREHGSGSTQLQNVQPENGTHEHTTEGQMVLKHFRLFSVQCEMQFGFIQTPQYEEMKSYRIASKYLLVINGKVKITDGPGRTGIKVKSSTITFTFNLAAASEMLLILVRC